LITTCANKILGFNRAPHRLESGATMKITRAWRTRFPKTKMSVRLALRLWTRCSSRRRRHEPPVFAGTRRCFAASDPATEGKISKLPEDLIEGIRLSGRGLIVVWTSRATAHSVGDHLSIYSARQISA